MISKQEIRQLGSKEMLDELQKARRELLRTQFDIRNGSSKEVHTVKNLKHYIAQLQTIAKEMKLDMNSNMSKPEVAPAETTEKAEKKAAAPKKAATAKAPKAPAKKTAKTTTK